MTIHRGGLLKLLQAFPSDPLQIGAVLVGENRQDRLAVGVEGRLPIFRRAVVNLVAGQSLGALRKFSRSSSTFVPVTGGMKFDSKLSAGAFLPVAGTMTAGPALVAPVPALRTACARISRADRSFVTVSAGG